MKPGPVTLASNPWGWVPNALSISRGVLAVPVYVTAVRGAWVLGFWLLILALITDFLDGLAAKKLHAESKLGGHIDRVSDFLLSVFGTLGLIVGADMLSLQLLWGAIPLSLGIGYVKFFCPEGSLVYRYTSIVSILLLFFVWIFVMWGYLTQAFGWSWIYPPVTFAVLTSAALFKRHRLRAWFGWLVVRNKKQ